MVARLWYGLSVALCVFDLDHTLIQTPLDLAAMAVDMRHLLEGANGPLPARNERYRVGELIAHCQTHAPKLEVALWELALGHERRAMGLADELDLVVTRDDMRALKPDPDGWRVISEHFGKLAEGAGDPCDAVIVGDSWVDGVAAAKAGVSFIAYRARQEDLDRWQVTPIVHLADLALLPAWLAARRAGRS